MKAFKISYCGFYRDKKSYVICENESEIKHTLDKYWFDKISNVEEVSFKEVEVKELNCQSLINLISIK